MKKKRKCIKKYEEHTLLDVFKIGDRVKQIYYDPNGYKYEYIGEIKDIKKHCMAVQWDTVNGKPNYDTIDVYNVCHAYEIFNGGKDYSPIVKYTS